MNFKLVESLRKLNEDDIFKSISQADAAARAKTFATRSQNWDKFPDVYQIQTPEDYTRAVAGKRFKSEKGEVLNYKYRGGQYDAAASDFQQTYYRDFCNIWFDNREVPNQLVIVGPINRGGKLTRYMEIKDGH